MESFKNKKQHRRAAGVATAKTQRKKRETIFLAAAAKHSNARGKLKRITAFLLLATTVLSATFIQSIFAGNNKAKDLTAKTLPAPTNTPHTLYVTNDSLGSKRVVTDEAGNVVSRRDFLPFGEEFSRATYGTDNIRQKFTGYERDAESGLDFAQARFYDFSHGRFTSPDPLLSSGRTSNPQTWNRFTYVGNNPLNITDPNGLDWYHNKASGRYKWYNDGEPVDDGFERVVGSRNFVYYAGESVGYVALNPTANRWQTFDTEASALGRVESIFNCMNCQSLANQVAEQSETKGKVVAGAAVVGVAVGTGVGVGMVLTGTVAGADIMTLGLTETAVGTGTAVATAAAANPDKTVQVIDGITIQFGKVANQISHAFRHTDALGLNRSDVRSAVESHLRGASSQIVAGRPFIQIIEVNGQRIQYTAYKLSDGTINVGRIHGVN